MYFNVNIVDKTKNVTHWLKDVQMLKFNIVHFGGRRGGGSVDKHLGLQRKTYFHDTYINCTISKFDELEHISLLIDLLNSWKFS